MSALQEIEEAVARAADAVGPSVVGLGRGHRSASGVVLADGLVLSTAHGRHAEGVTVTFADGRRETARTLGTDVDLDLAVLAVDTGATPAARFRDDTAVTLGRPVVALANPAGRGLRATLGLVSGTGAGFRGPRGRRITATIEHTAPLPRGASGGPLVDTDGQVIGLNALRLEGGFILALAADADLRARAESLARGESPARVTLGVGLAPARVARRLRRAVGLPERDGLLVRQVEPGSGAAEAGLEAGDLITAVDGEPLDSIDRLFAIVDARKPGDRLALAVLRGVEERQLEAVLRETPQGAR